MDRVSTLTSHTVLTNQMMKLQRQQQTYQLQVTTGKNSQSYSGIANTSQRLVNLENQRTAAERYKLNNEAAELRLKVTENSVDASMKTVRDFRQQLQDFSGKLDSLQADDVEDIRKAAFTAMKSLQHVLNVSVDGVYLFAGGRTDQRPVSFDYGTVEEFAAVYSVEGTPGSSSAEPRPFPEDAAAHRQDGAHFYVGDQITASHRVDENREIDIGIKADDPAYEKAFRALGMIAQDWGDPANWEDFASRLVDVAGDLLDSVVEYSPAQFADREAYEARPWELSDAQTAMNVENLAVTGLPNALSPVQISSTVGAGFTTVTVDIGGAVGSVNVPDGAAQASYSIAVGGTTISFDAVGAGLPGAITPPTARTIQVAEIDESSRDLRSIQYEIGMNQVEVDKAIERQRIYADYLSIRIDELENVDTAEAVTKLQATSLALEMSFATVSQVRKLSLVNYL